MPQQESRFGFLLGLLVLATTACTFHSQIRRAPELPQSTPWDLKALSQAPAFQWLDEKSPVRSLLYAGQTYHGTRTHVFAYYATPGTLKGDTSGDRKLPAVVLIHGGGGTAFREWAELWARRGYAAIAMDLQGNRPNEGQDPNDRNSRTHLPDGGPTLDHTNIFPVMDQPLEEHWPYHAVGNAIRGHSLIRSFPEVDPDRTAVTGISWGGYLTCIVASLDNRFKAAVPVYGCGFLDENSAWLDEFAKIGPQRTRRWVELYDPSRYLPACRVPIFFVNGANDFAYPLDSYIKSYDLVKHAPKNIRITVNMPHSHPAGWEPKEIGMFVDSKLTGGPQLPHVRLRPMADRVYAVELDAPTIKSVTAHVTMSTGSVNKRQWQDLPIWPPLGKTVSANDQPHDCWFETPAGATAWFATAVDGAGATVSSPVVFARTAASQ